MPEHNPFPAGRSWPCAPRSPALLRAAAIAAFAAALAGCSLISLKSPEKPLSQRDLNSRIVTREYSARFIAAVEQTADQIAAASEIPDVRLNALRWKIAATAASERAASQMAPLMGLLDTWALSAQMTEYFAAGNGAALFGAQQPLAAMHAADLAHEAQDLAQEVIAPAEFERYRGFVERYTRSNPIESLNFSRASLVDRWTREAGAQVKLVDSLGTVPEAMSNVGDMLRMYGSTAPSQVLWRAELTAQESGISRKDLQSALARADERISRLSSLADATPALVNGMVRDVRVRFDKTLAEILDTVHTEGETLAASLSVERAAAIQAVDEQRAAVTADAARIVDQSIRQAGEEIRRLVREALLLVIALSVVVLGMPFAAGYFVGRAQRRN